MAVARACVGLGDDGGGKDTTDLPKRRKARHPVHGMHFADGGPPARLIFAIAESSVTVSRIHNMSVYRGSQFVLNWFNAEGSAIL